MKNFIFLVIIAFLLLLSNGASAKKIKVKNKTGLTFSKVIVDYERLDGRHTHEYNGGTFGVNTRYSSAPNEKDTITYGSKIELKKGTCTLTFIGDSDSVCIVYGVHAEKIKTLTLDNVTSSIRRIPLSHLFISDGVQLYFNFINHSDLTIYDLYPKFKNKYQMESSLASNTDQRLLPKESRKIFIIQEGKEADYYMNTSMEFEIIAADKNGNVRRGHVEVNDLSAENIVISNSDFK